VAQVRHALTSADLSALQHALSELTAYSRPVPPPLGLASEKELRNAIKERQAGNSSSSARPPSPYGASNGRLSDADGHALVGPNYDDDDAISMYSSDTTVGRTSIDLGSNLEDGLDDLMTEDDKVVMETEDFMDQLGDPLEHPVLQGITAFLNCVDLGPLPRSIGGQKAFGDGTGKAGLYEFVSDRSAPSISDMLVLTCTGQGSLAETPRTVDGVGSMEQAVFKVMEVSESTVSVVFVKHLSTGRYSPTGLPLTNSLVAWPRDLAVVFRQHQWLRLRPAVAEKMLKMMAHIADKTEQEKESQNTTTTTNNNNNQYRAPSFGGGSAGRMCSAPPGLSLQHQDHGGLQCGQKNFNLASPTTSLNNNSWQRDNLNQLDIKRSSDSHGQLALETQALRGMQPWHRVNILTCKNPTSISAYNRQTLIRGADTLYSMTQAEMFGNDAMPCQCTEMQLYGYSDETVLAAIELKFEPYRLAGPDSVQLHMFLRNKATGVVREIRSMDEVREMCEGLEEHLFVYFGWMGVFDDLLPQLRFQAFRGYRVDFVLSEIHTVFVKFFEMAKDLTAATLQKTEVYRNILRTSLGQVRARINYDNQVKFKLSLPQVQQPNPPPPPPAPNAQPAIGKNRGLLLPTADQQQLHPAQGGQTNNRVTEPQLCVSDMKATFLKKMDGNSFSPCHHKDCSRVHYASIQERGFSAEVAKRQVLKVLGPGPYSDQLGLKVDGDKKFF
jgi:hypothetical protein